MSPRSRYNRIRMHGIANLRESGVVPPRRQLRRFRSMQVTPCPTVVLSQGGRRSRSCPTRATRSRAASAFASLQSVEFDELCRVSYPQGGHFIFFPPMRIAARNECPAPSSRQGGASGSSVSMAESVGAARHLAADLLAFTARLDALLHDLVLLPLARRRTVAACIGARPVGVFGVGAAASH